MATGLEQVSMGWAMAAKGCLRGLTNELCHRVMLALCFDGACNAVIFQDGEKKLHKVRGVWWGDDIQNLVGRPQRYCTCWCGAQHSTAGSEVAGCVRWSHPS